jgi:hypothetical protein
MSDEGKTPPAEVKAKKQKPAQRPPSEIEAIGVQYRAGVRSLDAIGAEFGLSKGRISQMAKEHGWTRDLKPKIKARAEAKLQAENAKAALNADELNDPAKQKASRLAEAEVVEASADLQVQTVMEHRRDIKRTRKLFLQLLGQLELMSTSDGKQLLTQMLVLVAGEPDADDPHGKKRSEKMADMLDKALSLSGSIDSAKKLTEMLEKLVRLEREAVGIEDDEKGGSDIDRLLLKINAGG